MSHFLSHFSQVYTYETGRVGNSRWLTDRVRPKRATPKAEYATHASRVGRQLPPRTSPGHSESRSQAGYTSRADCHIFKGSENLQPFSGICSLGLPCLSQSCGAG